MVLELKVEAFNPSTGPEEPNSKVDFFTQGYGVLISPYQLFLLVLLLPRMNQLMNTATSVVDALFY